MHVDNSLGTVSAGLKAAPYVTKGISQVAQKIDRNIHRVVGDSFGGSAALELQKNHPELSTRVYGTPIMDLLSRQQNAEQYRNEGDPLSMFDRSA